MPRLSKREAERLFGALAAKTEAPVQSGRTVLAAPTSPIAKPAPRSPALVDKAGTIVMLGLDPGSRVTGVGIVAGNGATARLVHVQALRTKVDAPLSERLGFLFTEVKSLIERHRPDEAAVETVFAAKNPASALKLGQARGAILAACAVMGVPVFGHDPTQIKKTLTGQGRAEKEQVAFMVNQILGVDEKFPKDASDALAAALCRLSLRRFEAIAGAATGEGVRL